MYDELDDEMHKQVPDARNSLQSLRDIGMTRFRFDDWLGVMQRRRIAEDDAKRRLQDLFELFGGGSSAARWHYARDYISIHLPRSASGA